MADDTELCGKKVILYARQSSGRDDKSPSTEVQIENMTKFCKEHGMIIIHAPFVDNNTRCEVYEDTPMGRAAAKHDTAFLQWQRRQRIQRTARKFRKALGEALPYTKEADYIMVYNDDRLYRKVIGSSLVDHINNILRENKCGIYYYETQKSRNFNFYEDDLFHEIEELILQRDLERKRERSICGIDKRKKDGRTVSNAWGVYRKKGDSNIYFDEKIAPIIRYVFEAFLNQKSMGNILYEMNTKYQEHLTVYSRKGEKYTAKRYYITNVQNILKNPTYCGLMRFNGKFVKALNIPEPIISEQTFYEAQHRLADNRKGRVKTVIDGVHIERRAYPFSGIIYCGNCGGKMVVSLDRGNLYYICKNAYETKNVKCGENRIRVNDFDGLSCLHSTIQKLFLISLIELQRKAYTLLNSNDDSDELAREISSLEEQKINIRKNYQRNLLTSAEYNEDLESVVKELEQRKAEFAVLQAQNREDIDTIIQEGYSAFMENTISDEMYFDFLHETIDTITVYSDRITIKLRSFNKEFSLPRIDSRTIISHRGSACKVYLKEKLHIILAVNTKGILC